MKQALYKGFCKLTLFVVMLAGAGLISGLEHIEEPGFWVLSNNQGSCPEGRVCAEWDVDGFREVACCIPESYVGSNDYSACDADLRN